MRAWLIIGLLGIVTGQPMQERQDSRAPQKHEKVSKQTPPPTAPFALVPCCQPPSTENQSTTKNKPSYWREAFAPPTLANWFLAITAIGAICVGLRTLAAIRGQGKILIDSERAWVLAEIGKLPDLSGKLDTVGILCIMPTFINSGKTVARIRRIALRQHQIPKPDKLPSEPHYTGKIRFDFILAPGKPIHMESGNVAITSQEYLKVTQGEMSLYVYGFVDYLDVGGAERQTRFCFVYHTPHGGDPTTPGFYPDLTAPQAYTNCT